MSIWERLAEKGITPHNIRQSQRAGIAETVNEGILPIRPHHATRHFAPLYKRTIYTTDLVEQTVRSVSKNLPARLDTIGWGRGNEIMYRTGLKAAFVLPIFLPDDFKVRITPYQLDLMCLNCKEGAHCRRLTSNDRQSEACATNRIVETAQTLDIPIKHTSDCELTTNLGALKKILQNLP